jgi:hypothetical protein
MNPVRVLYDKLPAKTRSTLRSLLPDALLRWYAHKKTDVYLISYPKCGRTWLRLMIGRAISCHYALPEDEDILFLRWKDRVHSKVPHITVVHDNRPMLKAPDELEKSKARYRDKKVILLVRDPRDVIVSSYFEMSKRGHVFGDNPHETRKAIFKGSLAEFISNRRGGFDTILAYYNTWAENRAIPKDFLLVRYEDMKINANHELRRVVDFLGLGEISNTEIAEAVEFASFENMQKMEAGGKFEAGMLKPADKSDRESYKTRRGETKGYVNYLSENEIQLLNQKIQNNLSDFYGYQP